MKFKNKSQKDRYDLQIIKLCTETKLNTNGRKQNPNTQQPNIYNVQHPIKSYQMGRSRKNVTQTRKKNNQWIPQNYRDKMKLADKDFETGIKR